MSEAAEIRELATIWRSLSPEEKAEVMGADADSGQREAMQCSAWVVLTCALDWIARGETAEICEMRRRAARLAMTPQGRRYVRLEAAEVGCSARHLRRVMADFRASVPLLMSASSPRQNT
jgi:hypothetical protein